MFSATILPGISQVLIPFQHLIVIAHCFGMFMSVCKEPCADEIAQCIRWLFCDGLACQRKSFRALASGIGCFCLLQQTVRSVIASPRRNGREEGYSSQRK